MKSYVLSVPPSDGHTVVPGAVAALGSCKRLEVMAGSLAFATPLDLCALRAMVDHAADICDSVFIDCPVTADVNNYLARMNFYEGIPANVELSRAVPVLRRTDRSTRLIEVCRVQSCDDVQRLEESVWAVAQPHFGTGPMARACVSVIAAATENVLDHAKSPVGAIVAAQNYRHSGLRLAVVDLGLGIPETLRYRAEYQRLADVDAVKRSLEDGVTSTGEPGRGAGLAEIIASARRTKNSTLLIQSGRAKFTLACSQGNARTHSARPGISTPGTWISLVLDP